MPIPAPSRRAQRHLGNQDQQGQGRRRALPLLLLLAGFLVLPVPAARADPGGAAKGRSASSFDSLDEEPLPPALPRLSSGDLLYVADACVFPGGDSLPRVEFYLRISNEQLIFQRLPSGERRARVRVDLRLATRDGRPVRRWSRESQLAAADSESASSVQIRQVLQWSYPIEPGEYVAEFEMTDLGAPKKSFAAMIRKSFRSGMARGLLRVRSFSRDSLEISDLEFAESFVAGDSSVFRKRRLTVYPNPGRRYGRADSDLKVYLEGHLPHGQSRADLRLIWEVLDPRGTRLILVADSLHADSTFDRAQVLRLHALAAGQYGLRLTVIPPEGPARKLEGSFDMAWAPGAALDRSVVALADEAHLLFENEELDDFLEMSPGRQEQYWNAYWARMNDSLELGEVNPKAEFESRIASANQSYGGNERGMFTDRGRIFVKYGPPDEITQRIMPVGGESLTDIGDQIPLEEGSNKGDLLRQPGAQGMGDTRSYEIWDYDMHGRTLYGTRVHQGLHGTRMRFVFVDQNGVGNYVLKYTSE